MRSVAVDDGLRDASTPLTRYYTASGNPPGRWLGSGLAGLADGLGLESGSAVSEPQMFRLFGQGADPVTGAGLGARPYRVDPGSGRGSVAGFDLTFSAPKSVSAWWGAADAHTQLVIAQAHHAAIEASLRLIEAQVAATRIGRDGVAQAEVRGVIATAFDHWDSRANDPNLHTHVVVANRVQAADGVWRTLDSRALYRAVVAISETYNGLLADELTRRLGVQWTARRRRHSALPAWEIDGVPDILIGAFSGRSHDIEQEKNRLIERFREQHGRTPSAVEVLRIRQQATLATRPDKQLHSLAVLSDRWRDRASAVLGRDAQAWAKGIGVDGPASFRRAGRLGPDHAAALAGSVRAAVEAKRSSWTRWNLHAEAARQLMGHRFADPEARLAAIGRLTDLAAADSIRLTPPELAPTPDALRRGDGSSMFTHRNSARFTSRILLDAEARLLDAGRERTGPAVPAGVVEEVLAAPPPTFRYRLGADQAAAVTAIACSGRTLDVLLGPAGTGKTVTLAGLRAAWEAQHGPGSVIGLAPSATAAQVLAEQLGIGTENTTKWLTEADAEGSRLTEIDRCHALITRAARANRPLAHALQQRTADLAARVERWRLHPGQLMIIDEASLAGTVTLDRITQQARTAGAKMLLVGDWAQLSAIDAGGAFRLLVTDRDTPPELGAVRRFTARWERDASRRIRVGDPDVIDTYQRHGRIRSGNADAMLDAAYQAWLADENAGRRSLLLAGDSDTVRELNARARAERVAAGSVKATGARLADGQIAGVGDRIVTRRNDRQLATGSSFVKNGDQWTVTRRGRDGSLRVQRPGGGPTITLPADYVAEHVELGYATSAYRAQGATVERAHAVIAASAMTRESLYVAMTRGRGSNTAYVTTDTSTGDCDRQPCRERCAARDVLTRVLANSGSDLAAHDALRTEQDAAAGIAQLAAEYETIAAHAQAPTWRRLLRASGLSDEQVTAAQRSPAWGALAAALRHADATGLRLEQRLPDLVAQRSLTDAADLAAVLHDRVARWVTAQPVSGRGLIAGLLPAARTVEDADNRDALEQRAQLIQQRAEALVRGAVADDAPWIRALGTPPVDPRRRAAWFTAATTVAAYHDRYTAASTTQSAQPAAPEQDVARRAAATAAALSQADLSQADLSQADLSRADLPRARTHAIQQPAPTRAPHR